jgi:hypothetical protein
LNKYIAIVEVPSGEIRVIVERAERARFKLAQNEIAVEVELERPNPSGIYWDFTRNSMRSKKRLSLQVEENTISKIPVGATVEVDDQKHIVMDGDIELVGAPNAVRRVVVRHPQYVTEIITLVSA